MPEQGPEREPEQGSGPIRRVAIIGAGPGGPVSGAALALLCVRAGYATILEDLLPGNLRRAASQLGAVPGLGYAKSIEDAVRDADLVIDTVPDELESKLEIFSLLDRMAPPHTLFATPIEALSIADLASCTYRPGQCFGLRVRGNEPLEIDLAYSPACTPDCLDRAERFLQKLGARVLTRQDTQALP